MALQLGRFRRISWRDALGGVIAPALRLHHYRELHSKSLLDALRTDDARRGGHEDQCE